ncbi:PREDICTED: tRNA methyltransferase 112 homolog [Elephantulus edwardii]|uniref:tRNA methyltransferase 112 homolog n=1 Tax=Elephantulus edwardii TaxID=28737 RepID=UPI0003F06E0A|nr:PREDICTED: tRNA methyltransferase 112 homolog [Elephantulus edwardii]
MEEVWGAAQRRLSKVNSEESVPDLEKPGSRSVGPCCTAAFIPINHSRFTAQFPALYSGFLQKCLRQFPLRLQATEVRVYPVEFNPDFVARMIPKVEWAALLEATETLHLVEVPKGPTEGYEHDEAFLRKMHHMLLEVDVLEGTLQCPESGRLFPISRGIPNMLLNDEETET